MTVEKRTGRLTIAPPAGAAGSFNLRVGARDSAGSAAAAHAVVILHVRDGSGTSVTKD